MSADLERWMGRIETKIDGLVESVKTHEARVSSLETDRDKAKGALWGVGAVAGVIGAFVHKVISMVN
jgi:hypothetical protein